MRERVWTLNMTLFLFWPLQFISICIDVLHFKHRKYVFKAISKYRPVTLTMDFNSNIICCYHFTFPIIIFCLFYTYFFCTAIAVSVYKVKYRQKAVHWNFNNEILFCGLASFPRILLDHKSIYYTKGKIQIYWKINFTWGDIEKSKMCEHILVLLFFVVSREKIKQF